MTARSTRDIYALEFGFLADNVIQALLALQRGEITDSNLRSLDAGSALLRALSAGVGPSTDSIGPSLALTAINSFSYAAEALKLSPGLSFTDGLRDRFASLADYLQRAKTNINPNPDEIQELLRFFKGLSSATLESWNSVQPASILETITY